MLAFSYVSRDSDVCSSAETRFTRWLRAQATVGSLVKPKNRSFGVAERISNKFTGGVYVHSGNYFGLALVIGHPNPDLPIRNLFLLQQWITVDGNCINFVDASVYELDVISPPPKKECNECKERGQ
jgi:hypothetical protein